MMDMMSGPMMLAMGVLGGALFAAIRERGLAQETPLLVATLRAFAKDWLKVEDGRLLGGAPLELPATSLPAPAAT